MFDNCSQSTFIANKTTEKLKLKGIPITFLLICTDGSEKQMQGKLFNISLVDIKGEHHQLEAIGLDQLSSTFPGIKVRNIKSYLKDNDAFETLSNKKLERTAGEVDLMIGSDLASLHPKHIQNIGQLSIMKSLYGLVLINITF